MMNAKKNALGRGLGALIADAETIKSAIVNEIPIHQIEVNPYQPRTEFDEEALQELSESIRLFGIIQPITVRKIEENRYQLISGERRLRASISIGLESIPAYVRQANDQEMLEMALIENIHRKDLDPIEIALSYQRLIDECNLTQEQLSERVRKNRSTIANFLRLLKLPDEIQLGLKQNKISVGHARALINIDDPETQRMIYQQILKYDFSVRKVEDIVRELNIEAEKNTVKTNRVYQRTKEIFNLKEQLRSKLNCKVDIKKTNLGTGKIVVYFDNEHQFDQILKKLTE
ncbi:MAG: ParB/RepB/Spo0J family partition protein [Bacteroidales bacterium]|nr:ParB/RepB/Spo0J family partition protein [Bacteroidales bacterium]